MSFQVTYHLPGYESAQVERFASQDAADRRYDELAANPDVHRLAQPVDTAAASEEPASVQIQVNVSVETSEPQAVLSDDRSP